MTTVNTLIPVVRNDLPDFVKERKADMDPFLLLSILAVFIGLVGVVVLMKSRRKNLR